MAGVKRPRVLSWRPTLGWPFARFNIDDPEPVVVVNLSDRAEPDRPQVLVLTHEMAVILARRLSDAAGQARADNVHLLSRRRDPKGRG